MNRAGRACVAALLGCVVGLSAATEVVARSQITNHKSQIDRSLASAARYLVRKQSADGAWRSQTYGCFKDGPSLTGLVLSATFFMPQGGAAAMKQSYKRGADYLVRTVGDDGSIKTDKYGLTFPVLSAASASRVVALLEKTPRNLAAQQAWLKLLRGYQLNASLGWSPSDAEFGGWGFSLKPPTKPKRGEMREAFAESNMVATIFAIGALRSAKVAADDPVWKDVLAFVERCQNFGDDSVIPSHPVILSRAKNPGPEKQILRSAQNDEVDPAGPGPRDPGPAESLDDGGFFFIPTDPLQNKAGVAGKDEFGRTRFHSYGSMTADGLRALVRCGLPPDHPRVVAARKWLEASFSVEHVPGIYEPDHEVLRDATYYYWCWSVAHAFGETSPPTPLLGGEGRWAVALAEELIKRQRPDGSWANRFTDAKEDDPLVATPWAAAALAICREVITGEIKELAPRRGRPQPPPTPPS